MEKKTTPQQSKPSNEKKSKKPRIKLSIRNPFTIDWKCIQNSEHIEQVLSHCGKLKKEKYNPVLKFGINQATKSLEQKICKCLVIINQYFVDSSEDSQQDTVQTFLNSHRMNPVEHLFTSCAIQQIPCFILHGNFCSPEQLGQCFSSQKPVSMTCFAIIKNKTQEEDLNAETDSWIEDCKQIFNSKDFYTHTLPWLSNPSVYMPTKVSNVEPLNTALNRENKKRQENSSNNNNTKKVKHL